jgi:hypothetical protein
MTGLALNTKISQAFREFEDAEAFAWLTLCAALETRLSANCLEEVAEAFADYVWEDERIRKSFKRALEAAS